MFDGPNRLGSIHYIHLYAYLIWTLHASLLPPFHHQWCTIAPSDSQNVEVDVVSNGSVLDWKCISQTRRGPCCARPSAGAAMETDRSVEGRRGKRSRTGSTDPAKNRANETEYIDRAGCLCAQYLASVTALN